MNRRDFLVFSLSALALTNSKSLLAAESNTSVQTSQQVKILQTYWGDNFSIQASQYLEKKSVSSSNFDYLNKAELAAGKVLKFDGIYFSHLELALLVTATSYE